jgi:hypothetical protein
MSDYKTCKLRDTCPMAKKFAEQPGVKLDCSKCKDYISTENKCGDCEHYDKRDAYCGKKHESRFFRENTAACGEYKQIENKPEHDAVHAPNHYTSGGIECKDCIKAALGERYIGFLLGNVMKYVYRYRSKNGKQDLEKAAVYLQWAIEEMNDERTE